MKATELIVFIGLFAFCLGFSFLAEWLQNREEKPETSPEKPDTSRPRRDRKKAA